MAMIEWGYLGTLLLGLAHQGGGAHDELSRMDAQVSGLSVRAEASPQILCLSEAGVVAELKP